jgi:phosphoadenosine phosphosulfate reductase
MKAIQFSGGKDSTVMLYRLKHLWDEATVFWVSTGDTPPEVRDFVEAVRAMVPSFVEIASDVISDKAANGFPTDYLSNTDRIAAAGGTNNGKKRRTSFDCCFSNIMLPMHEAMKARGVTEIYRGQRNDDANKAPLQDGQVVDGVTYRFPIKDLTEQQVLAELDLLRKQGLPVPTWYNELNSTPDCLHCTGWLSENRGSWLKKNHPEAYILYSKEIAALVDDLRAAAQRLEEAR